MTQKIKGHLHRYKRVKYGKNGRLVFKCMSPGCTHFKDVVLCEGALVECNRCGSPFVMDKVSLSLAKPHCKECTKSKKQPALDTINKFLEGRV